MLRSYATLKVGQVLGMESSWKTGVVDGVKLLKDVTVDYTLYWIVAVGSASNGGDFVLDAASDLVLMSNEHIRKTYSKEYVKGPQYKDGDVLASKDAKHIFIVRGTLGGDIRLTRLTPNLNGQVDQSYCDLAYYERKFGSLELLYVSNGSIARTRFSDPVKPFEKS